MKNALLKNLLRSDEEKRVQQCHAFVEGLAEDFDSLIKEKEKLIERKNREFEKLLDLNLDDNREHVARKLLTLDTEVYLLEKEVERNKILRDSLFNPIEDA